MSGLPPAPKEKPTSTKLAFGAGQNIRKYENKEARKRQTWSDRGSEKSKSPQKSIKKPVSSKIEPAPE